MSATNNFENDLMKLLFTNVDLPNIGNAGGLLKSTADGSFYVALFTADPGETGTGSGAECTYTGYARKAVGRAAGWTVSGNNASNAAAVTFDPCTGGTETATHFAIFTALTDGDDLLYGELDSSLAISNGITPEFAIGALDVNLD